MSWRRDGPEIAETYEIDRNWCYAKGGLYLRRGVDDDRGRLLHRQPRRTRSHSSDCHPVAPLAAQRHPDECAALDPAAALVRRSAERAPGPHCDPATNRLATVAHHLVLCDELSRGAARRVHAQIAER